jgi:hypothetical protein
VYLDWSTCSIEVVITCVREGGFVGGTGVEEWRVIVGIDGMDWRVDLGATQKAFAGYSFCDTPYMCEGRKIRRRFREKNNKFHIVIRKISIDIPERACPERMPIPQSFLVASLLSLKNHQQKKERTAKLQKFAA